MAFSDNNAKQNLTIKRYVVFKLTKIILKLWNGVRCVARILNNPNCG